MSYSADMNLDLFEMDASSAVHLSNLQEKSGELREEHVGYLR